jgi:REP-associated tyrosine transposase
MIDHPPALRPNFPELTMPRHPRIAVPDVPVHVIQRGNNRGACFFVDEDYARYLGDLRRLAPQFECAVHAYCLMTNHVHLLLTPRTAAGCGLLMKHLGQRYVQYVNRTHDRSGTLWEGRFRSCLVHSETYMLTCYRYVELNPVRARMVRHPRQYPWSSYRVNGDGKPDTLITPHDLYLRLGRSRRERAESYRELLQSRLDETTLSDIRQATNGGFVLGSGRFAQKIARMLGRRVERGMPGRPRNDDRDANGRVPPRGGKARRIAGR